MEFPMHVLRQASNPSAFMRPSTAAFFEETSSCSGRLSCAVYSSISSTVSTSTSVSAQALMPISSLFHQT